MLRAVRSIIINMVLWGIISIAAEGYNISDRLSLKHLVRRKRTEAPPTFAIKYHDHDQLKEVVFKRVVNTIPSSLVPIWDLTDDDVSDRYLLEHLEIICYHGVNSYSAITYFAHTGKLHGVIDYKFYIDDLPLSAADNPDSVRQFIHPMVDNLPNLQLPESDHRRKRMIQEAENIDDLRCLLYKKFRKTLYPEIFLIVDTTTRIDFYNHEHPYEKAAIYALAYWNAVDMLFSHLKRTEIKINIAGIVVGETADVIAFFHPDDFSVDEDSRFYVMNQAALDALGSKIYGDVIQIKRDSYDFLIWMTEASLLTPHGRNRGGPELGIAAPPSACGGKRDEEERTRKVSNRAVIMHDSRYTNYQTAARELATMMFVSPDDLRRRDCLSIGPSRGIMDPSNERVEGCLRWSYQSEADFSAYSSSTASCCLLNFPYRTMGETMPVPSLSLDRQCQCYKMESPDLLQNYVGICRVPLQCKNQGDEFVDVGIPLDGTPCQNFEDIGHCRENECV